MKVDDTMDRKIIQIQINRNRIKDFVSRSRSSRPVRIESMNRDGFASQKRRTRSMFLDQALNLLQRAFWVLLQRFICKTEGKMDAGRENQALPRTSFSRFPLTPAFCHRSRSRKVYHDCCSRRGPSPGTANSRVFGWEGGMLRMLDGEKENRKSEITLQSGIDVL